MPSTDQEQYLLELVNDARLDPLGDAARYLTAYNPLTSNQQDIQQALNQFGVSGPDLLAAFTSLVPVQPLAWNDSLATAARQHDQAMIAANTQSHQEPGESDPMTRDVDAGYSSQTYFGENVFAFDNDVLEAQAGFMVDWGNATPGHRTNIMKPVYREVGIGIQATSTSYPNVGPLLVTEDFGARSGSDAFVLGVAYNDTDHDDFYSIGEGVAGLTVSVDGVTAISTESGGYTLETGSSGQQTVTFDGGGLAGPVNAQVDLASGSNVKIDIVSGTILKTSTSLTVLGPVSRIEGLGTIGLSLTDGAASITFVGSLGADVFTGGAGGDTYEGTLAQLSGDTITAIASGDKIHFTDVNLASFAYSLAGSTLSFGGGTGPVDTLTLNNGGNLAFAAQADPSGGVDLLANLPANGGGTGTGSAADFGVADTTTGTTSVAAGDAYAGPVADLQYQYINTSTDNLNVTAGVANSFVHTGSGFDAIDVSKVGGTNVLDGGTGSNFLVGGTGAASNDTFFVDDRGPTADIWSTVANFHAGDSATVFGITQQGFSTEFFDGQGAAGYTGLTLHATAGGVPTASITLAGYSMAELGNGALSTTFGSEPDGTPYLYIHANS